jgi:hypothetical protein
MADTEASMKGATGLEGFPPFAAYHQRTHVAGYLSEVFDTSNRLDIYARWIAQGLRQSEERLVVTIAPGDGRLELELAEALFAAGARDFEIERILPEGTSPTTRDGAYSQQARDSIKYNPWNLEEWRPRTRIAGILTRDGLHRAPSIHRIIQTLHKGLTDGGYFVADERIGRNGHTSWPEAAAIIQAAWRTLPADRKQNHRDARDEASAYLNIPSPPTDADGIRSGYILGLLAERFHFSHFAAWGSLTDAIVDQRFAPCFSPDRPEDTAFLQRLDAAERNLLQLGYLKPTSMLSVLTREQRKKPRHGAFLPPAASIRFGNMDPFAPTGPRQTPWITGPARILCEASEFEPDGWLQ